MAHQVIKYRLTAEGTIPSFLCLHPEGVVVYLLLLILLHLARETW